MSRLPADCLNVIFEYLDNDLITLHSCILVNRLWCEVSVEILWRNVENYSTSNFKTLIACLPNESKEILYENRINIYNILPSTSKLPIFNYASFCKVLSVKRIHYKLENLLKNDHRFIPSQTLISISINIIAEEILKLFVKQIPSLERLEITKFWQFLSLQIPTTNFISYPEAKNCLKNLSMLCCSSNIPSDFFYKLSQISHNISLLDLTVKHCIPIELVDFISAQKRLKCLNINVYHVRTDLITLLMKKIPNTLTKFNLYGISHNIPLLFMNNFTDLQELHLELYHSRWFNNFEILQYTYFSKLQILKLKYALPKSELLIKFLEINGKNLREIYLCESGGYNDNPVNLTNLAIAKFCPILRKLSTGIKSKELGTLKIIFDSCQQLESIKIWCGNLFLNEKEALDTVVKYSKNIYEIILFYQDDIKFGILPEELESFFISWTDRMSQKSLSLIIVSFYSNSIDRHLENLKIIQKYLDLGVIKNFKAVDFTND
ncbi:hypothetical protein RclHR1_15440004 [Rhizophagus clarus]|uniref:F-box domain-containing protein n=1 Tax=Rhizophagus clarus TaxID=94130 RepID=A0A2Z6QF46_9GLOM|nr:hypothetical protein RclHR1_15440004 [Rhizophagus clarus]GES91056.1 hypothetical protein GLOIN_2v1784405 [Rhizophagus clarus]